MIYRSIDPSTDKMFIEALGIQFISQMAIDIVGNHKSQKSEQGCSMMRYQKNDEKNN